MNHWTTKDTTGKENTLVANQRKTTGKRCIGCGGPLKTWMRQKYYCKRECRLKIARERYREKKLRFLLEPQDTKNL